MLDEIAAALAALRLSECGFSDATAAGALVALSIGALAGAFALERALERVMGAAILAASAVTSILALALFVTATSSAGLLLGLILLGATAAPHYALVKAAAYRLVPHQPGLVNAVAQLFVVVELAMPLALGWIATEIGLRAALACLAAQPIAVLGVAWATRRDQPQPPPI